MAEQYMDSTTYTYKDMVQQLETEGFTKDQANSVQKPSAWNNRILQADDLPDYTDLTSETVLAASLFFCQKTVLYLLAAISFTASSAWRISASLV